MEQMLCSACGCDINQGHAEDCALSQPTVPVVWRTPDGKAAITSRSPIIPPDENEMKMLQEQAHNVCGTCKYFEHAHGQQQIKAQQFVERLVKEENWQTKHLVSPLNELGICGAHDSGSNAEQMITGTMHKACDQYGPSNNRLRVVK